MIAPSSTFDEGRTNVGTEDYDGSLYTGSGAGRRLIDDRTLPANPARSIVMYQCPELGTINTIGDLFTKPP